MKKCLKYLFLLMFLVGVAGCSLRESPAPDPAPNEPPVLETMEVAVYYLKSTNNDMYLVREAHEEDKTKAVAHAGLNE